MSAITKLSPEIQDLFTSNQNETTPLPSAHALALLSYHSYFDNAAFEPILSEYQRIEDKYSLKEQFYCEKISILMVTSDSAKAILAFAESGPIPKNKYPFINLENLLEQIEKSVLTIITKYPEYNYFVCGHYIGGIIAQYIAIKFNLGGASYGSPGIYDGSVSLNLEQEPDEKSKKMFFNHLVLPFDDEYLNTNYFDKFNYFGDIVEHFPFHQKYIWFQGGNCPAPSRVGPEANQEFFFDLRHFIDFHFSFGENNKFKKLLTYSGLANVEFNDLPCDHHCCYTIERRKKQIDDDSWNNKIAFTILGTVWGSFATLFGFLYYDSKKDEEKRKEEARRKFEEERRRQ